MCGCENVRICRFTYSEIIQLHIYLFAYLHIHAFAHLLRPSSKLMILPDADTHLITYFIFPF